jgi:hypothetical protein
MNLNKECNDCKINLTTKNCTKVESYSDANMDVLVVSCKSCGKRNSVWLVNRKKMNALFNRINRYFNDNYKELENKFYDEHSRGSRYRK